MIYTHTSVDSPLVIQPIIKQVFCVEFSWFPAWPLIAMEEPGSYIGNKCLQVILSPGDFVKLCPRVIRINVSKEICIVILT